VRHPGRSLRRVGGSNPQLRFKKSSLEEVRDANYAESAQDRHPKFHRTKTARPGIKVGNMTKVA
jgi:hypothetical protein